MRADTGGWWVSEWISVSGRSDSIWGMELIPLQFPDSTYTKSIPQTSQPREQLPPLLGTKTSSLQLLFSASMTNANFQQTPQLFLDLLMIYWEKQKVIWCARWEEWCRVGTGVRPVLFNGRKHFWLKAADWEPPLSAYANLETAHSHTHFWSDIRT